VRTGFGDKLLCRLDDKLHEQNNILIDEIGSSEEMGVRSEVNKMLPIGFIEIPSRRRGGMGGP